MLGRRTFLGVIGAALVFPWSIIRKTFGHRVCELRYPPEPWRILRQQVGPFHCRARYRFQGSAEGTYCVIDYQRFIALRTPETDEMDYPALVFTNDPPSLRFMQTVPHEPRVAAVMES